MRDLGPKNSDERNSALQQSIEQQCGRKKKFIIVTDPDRKMHQK